MKTTYTFLIFQKEYAFTVTDGQIVKDENEIRLTDGTGAFVACFDTRSVQGYWEGETV